MCVMCGSVTLVRFCVFVSSVYHFRDMFLLGLPMGWAVYRYLPEHIGWLKYVAPVVGVLQLYGAYSIFRYECVSRACAVHRA
jgi:hypothetical protein